jgi:hypothetical protein
MKTLFALLCAAMFPVVLLAGDPPQDDPAKQKAIEEELSRLQGK